MKKKEEEVEEHPCFGMVGFSRLSGGIGQLFGSHLDEHYEVIRLRISRGVRRHGLSHDWFMGKKQLIEVDLSPQQFAQLLTSMNVGDGVPCTIRFLESQGCVESMPVYETEQLKILKNVDESLKEMISENYEKYERLKEILEKKTLSKKDRSEILGLVRGMFDWFESSASFAFKSFEESAEKVVTAAKSQVDAFVLSTFVKLGMEKLSSKFALQEKFVESHSRLPEKK